MKTLKQILVMVIGVLFCFQQSCLSQQDMPTDTVKMTSGQQKSLAVTIYNNNLGLIKDIREVKLQRGTNSVWFMDVASGIIPASVHVKSLTSPDKFYLLEQNYEYDLINHSKLMDKYVGKEVKLIFKSQMDGTEEERTAVLLSNNGSPVFKIDDEIHLGFPGRVILPKLPDNLLAKPTLVWLIDNQAGTQQELEVSYLTNGISWECDYVLVLSRDDSSAGLTGWVTINNQSGTTYPSAGIKLVAGDVRRERKRYARDNVYMMEVAMAPRAKKQFQEEEFFEYHLYTLDRKTTIKQNQIKQIGLIEASEIPLEKKFMVYGQQHFYTSSYNSPIKDIPVSVMLKFKNSEDNNLGMPLPAGVIRVYKADKDNMLQFVGENRIKHTPKDEKIEIKVGDAFDIKAERKQVDWRKLRAHMYEVEWQINIRNHKKEDITVIAQEPLPGDWEIIETSFPYKKIASQTVHFSIPVKADSESILIYKARIKY